MKLTGRRNQCPTCSEYFNRNSGFEGHRVGKIGKDRRCLTAFEMTMRGWTKNSAGFWMAPIKAENKASQECRFQTMGRGKTAEIEVGYRYPYAEAEKMAD